MQPSFDRSRRRRRARRPGRRRHWCASISITPAPAARSGRLRHAPSRSSSSTASTFAQSLPPRRRACRHGVPHRPAAALLRGARRRGARLLARSRRSATIKAALHEQSLIACPIESYGERIGALVISQSDPRRNFDAEDLEFAQSVAERIGAASHIHRLTRIAQDGHRAAEELARREVDARVRFEAVLETRADRHRRHLRRRAALRARQRALHRLRRATSARSPLDTKVIGLRGSEVIAGVEQILKQVAESGEPRIDEELRGRRHVYVNRIISAARGRFSGITQSLTVLVQDVTEQVRAQREIEDLADDDGRALRASRLDPRLDDRRPVGLRRERRRRRREPGRAEHVRPRLARGGDRARLVRDDCNLRDPDGRADRARRHAVRARAGADRPFPITSPSASTSSPARDLDLSIAAAPIESNGIVGAVLVIRDITALQELDRKKDEFLSVASHELRTPLTTIKGYTQLLAQTVNDLQPEERATYINAVLGEIERMMGLISELLDVSRIETNRLQIHPQPIRWVDFIAGRVVARSACSTRRARSASNVDAGETHRRRRSRPHAPGRRQPPLERAEVLAGRERTSTCASRSRTATMRDVGERSRHRHPARRDPAALRALPPRPQRLQPLLRRPRPRPLHRPRDRRSPRRRDHRGEAKEGQGSTFTVRLPLPA